MKNVLFLGNSFTFFNDLPAMMKKLCDDENIEVFTDSVTRGGAYLRQFTDPADELSAKLAHKLGERKWDTVILQDQSANPARNPDDIREACKKIAALFPENTEFLLYQTWSYRDATEKLASVRMTYPEMRRKLREGYTQAADAIGGRTVPVGEAFALASREGIDVYCSDDYHPNEKGTYIAACAFIRSIWKKIPSSAPSGIDAVTAAIARTCAASV